MKLFRKKTVLNKCCRTGQEVEKLLQQAAFSEEAQLMKWLGSSPEGMNESQLRQSRRKFGGNTITIAGNPGILQCLKISFINPFTEILFILGIFSFMTDVAEAPPGQADPTACMMAAMMILISGSLHYIQKRKSSRLADSFMRGMKATVRVLRRMSGETRVPLEDIAAGDRIFLSAGDAVPADIRLFHADHLSVSQAVLTGESRVLGKHDGIIRKKEDSAADYANIVFMGTRVISGSAEGTAVAVGDNTLFGQMASSAGNRTDVTEFDKGIQNISRLLMRCMFVMVPAVWIINGMTKGNWMEAAFFALSVAVSITPEMLPVIVTACLVRGVSVMAKENTVIKNLGAMQNIGAMNLLCTDKTGTLTEGRTKAAGFADAQGHPSSAVFRDIFLYTFYQKSDGHLMDEAVMQYADIDTESAVMRDLWKKQYFLLHENPFDFHRRRGSVVLGGASVRMIARGAAEEILSICRFVLQNDKILPLTGELADQIRKEIDSLNRQGISPLAVAAKDCADHDGRWTDQEEADMVFEGWVSFMDPLKSSAKEAVLHLRKLGVQMKILTGDTAAAAEAVCSKLGMKDISVMSGPEVTDMDDEALGDKAEKTAIFARLCPEQKARIIRVLRRKGCVVGYMGDGMNDLSAMQAADVSISVETGADAAKEAAHMILAQPDLTVLGQMAFEGRKTYLNMMKYIKITLSSNFGNALSVLSASIFLPFLPMQPIQLLLMNLLYDLSCLSIPWDRADTELLQQPRTWDVHSVRRFMLWMGPASSVFDMITFGGMYFFLCPMMTAMHFGGQQGPGAQTYFCALFQTGWMVESMWSQTLIFHMLRTPKVPFLQSRASLQVSVMTAAAAGAVTVLPFMPWGRAMGLTELPAVYFLGLAAVSVLYVCTAIFLKQQFIRHCGTFLV